MKHIAISYETSHFNDLQYFMHEQNIVLNRQSPEDFVRAQDFDNVYINLVTRDMTLRKTISDILDLRNLKRFSFVHKHSSVCVNYENKGIFIYPNCVVYPGVILESDIIIHSLTAVAHNTVVSQGCFISGGCTLGGSVEIGKNCWIGMSVVIYDQVKLCDFVMIGASSTIRKSIDHPGTYSSNIMNTTKKIHSENTIP